MIELLQWCRLIAVTTSAAMLLLVLNLSRHRLTEVGILIGSQHDLPAIGDGIETGI